MPVVNDIVEIPLNGFVSLAIDTDPQVFLALFMSRAGFIVTHLTFHDPGQVVAVVTSTYEGWANLCRDYPNDDFVQVIENHFVANHKGHWLEQGMV